jgi:uncharacterized membrane protein YedE/YeeE
MIDASWLEAGVGGALIGLSAGGMMLLNGRVAGISGIFHRATEGDHGVWRWAFLFGMLISGLAWRLLFAAPGFSFSIAPDSTIAAVTGGLLVGFGTRMGDGCTSGHGICGLARLSSRSLVAVLVFMGTGFAVTAAMRYLGGN